MSITSIRYVYKEITFISKKGSTGLPTNISERNRFP